MNHLRHRMQRLTNAATNLQIVLLLTMLLAICSFVVMVSP